MSQYNIDLSSLGMGSDSLSNLVENPLDFGFANSKNDAQGNQTMQLRKLFMGRTRPQRNQDRRSYDVFLDGVGMNAVQNKIDQYGQEAFSPSELGDIMTTSNIIKLSGTAEAAVGIENGWQEERFMFVLIVDIFRNGRFMRTEFITGHTDGCSAISTDFNMDVKVNPDMVFTINHISEANMRNTDVNGNPVTMMSTTSTVLTNSNFTSFSNTAGDLYMMRPSDIIKATDKVAMQRGVQELESQYGMQNTYRDLDSTLARLPMMSNDQFNLIPTFTGRILNGLYGSRLSSNDPMNMDGTGAGELASALISDTPFTKNGFVFLMNRETANGVGTTSKFCFRDLMRMDHTIDDRTVIFGRSYESGDITFPSANNTDILGASTSIAVHATHILQTVLSLMAIAGITTIGFNANNNGGRAEVTLQACEGMDYDGNMGRRLQAFKARLIIECLNIVSSGDQVHFNIDVFASAVNDVFIQIQWGMEKSEYIFPAFAHAVTLPTVTNTMSRLTDVAEKVTEIVDMLDVREKGHRQQFGSNLFANTAGGNHYDVGNF